MEIRSNLSSHRTTTRHSSKQTEDDPEIEDLPAGQPPPLTDPLVQRDLDQLDKDGYVIIPNLLSESYLRELRMASEPHLTHVGRNNFEGLRTKRVYGLLGKSRTFDHLVAHPRIISLLEQRLLPNFLLTAFQVISIQPDEKPQPLHFDDGFCYLPRPREPLSYATIWAIDAFTKENGGTIVIPGSHKWGNRRPTAADMKHAIQVEMPPGSVVFFSSLLWHGGGPSKKDAPCRLAISAQYCQPWVRPQENQFLIVPPEEVPKLSPAVQALIGYAIHPPFIGHANGKHPLKALELLRSRGSKL